MRGNRNPGAARRSEQALMIKAGVKAGVIRDLDAAGIAFGADLA